MLKDSKHDSLFSILSQYPDVTKPDDLNVLLREHLKRRSITQNQFQILLYTYVIAGVGEFIHLLDFFTYYRQFMQGWREQINLRALCIVEEKKFAAIKQQLEYRQDLSKDNIYLVEPGKVSFDEKIADNRSLILWVECLRTAKHVLTEQRRSLLDFINRHSATVTISTSVGLNCQGNDFSHNDILINTTPSNCYKQIISQMGFKPVFSGGMKLVDFYKMPKANLFVPQSMGMGVNREYHCGIKFNSKILDYVTSKKNPAELLENIEDKNLLKTILAEQTREEFLEKTDLYFAYIQSSLYAEYFISTALTLSEKPRIVIITNQSCWNQNVFNLLKQTPSKSELTIIDLKGISEHDKNILEAMAQIDGSSGDSSHSAQISGGAGRLKFPFFQPRLWSVCFFVDIIRELKKMDGDFTDLIKIFSHFIGMCEDIGRIHEHRYGSKPNQDEMIKTSKEEYCHFITQHKAAIMRQFHQYCQYLYQNHNLIQEQNNIFFRALISSVLIRGSAEEQAQLFSIIKNWQIDKTNFVFILVEAQKWDILETMRRINQPLFMRLLSVKHPQSKMTPLHLAMLKVDSNPVSATTVFKIIDYGASIKNEMTFEDFTNHAVTMENIPLFKYGLNIISKKIGGHGLGIYQSLSIISQPKISPPGPGVAFKIHSSSDFKSESIERVSEIKGRSEGQWKKLTGATINGIFFEKRDVFSASKVPAIEMKNSKQVSYAFSGNGLVFSPGYAVFEFLMNLIANSYLPDSVAPALLIHHKKSRNFSICSQEQKNAILSPNFENLKILLPKLILRKIILRDADITNENFVNGFIIDLTDAFMDDLGGDKLLKINVELFPFEIFKWLKVRDQEKTLDLPDLEKWQRLIIRNYCFCIKLIVDTLQTIVTNIQKMVCYRASVIAAAQPMLGKSACEFIRKELKKSEYYFFKLFQKFCLYNFISAFAEQKDPAPKTLTSSAVHENGFFKINFKHCSQMRATQSIMGL